MLTAAWLYNLGLNNAFTLWFATVNYKGIDLTKAATFNYQGIGARLPPTFFSSNWR